MKKKILCIYLRSVHDWKKFSDPTHPLFVKYENPILKPSLTKELTNLSIAVGFQLLHQPIGYIDLKVGTLGITCKASLECFKFLNGNIAFTSVHDENKGPELDLVLMA